MEGCWAPIQPEKSIFGNTISDFSHQPSSHSGKVKTNHSSLLKIPEVLGSVLEYNRCFK